jgi:dipeptidase E
MQTNDMPIVYPPSFKIRDSSFRPQRTFLTQTCNQNTWVKLETSNKEFHAYTHPVLGLREGSWLKVDGDQIVKGEFSARLFKQIRSLKRAGTDISYVK